MMQLESVADYESTKSLLEQFSNRLLELDSNSTLSTSHREDARRSYERLMAQLRAQLELFESQQHLAASR